MRTIWKFPLRAVAHQVVTLPGGGRPIHVGVQDETLCMWATVDTDAPELSIDVLICGTGSPVPEDAPPYIGTVHVSTYVWHVFAERRT